MSDTDALLLDIVRQLGDLNSTLGRIAKALEAKRPVDVDDEDVDDWVAFVRQNPYSGEVTPEVMVDLMPWTDRPAGDLWILQRQLEGGYYVKMHDTWSPLAEEGKITVHVFDPDGATVEAARFFDRANAAAALFLNERLLDDLWAEAQAEHRQRAERFGR